MTLVDSLVPVVGTCGDLGPEWYHFPVRRFPLPKNTTGVTSRHWLSAAPGQSDRSERHPRTWRRKDAFKAQSFLALGVMPPMFFSLIRGFKGSKRNQSKPLKKLLRLQRWTVDCVEALWKLLS